MKGGGEGEDGFVLLALLVSLPSVISSFLFKYCCSCLLLHYTLALGVGPTCAYLGLISITTQWCIYYILTFFGAERIKSTLQVSIYSQVSVISYRSLIIHPKLLKFK